MAHVTGGSKTINIAYADWSNIQPQPIEGLIASLDANTMTDDLTNQTVQAVTMDGAGDIRERHQIPSTSEFGWRFRYDGVSPENNGPNNEKYYSVDRQLSHSVNVYRIYQATNYEKRIFSFVNSVEASGFESDWQVGDTITTSGGSATLVQTIPQSSGSSVRLLFDGWSAPEFIVFPNGATVTNDRNGETFTVATAGLTAANHKLCSLWVNDGVNGQRLGYSQSGILIETNTTEEHTPNDIPKVARLSSVSSGIPTSSTLANELAPLAVIFDTDDNGSFINLAFERIRATTETSNDGEIRIWKMTERSGGSFPTWTLIYRYTGLEIYHSASFNGFNAGYLFGAANGGFSQQTDQYLNKFDLYDSRPQFLTDAGV